MGVELPLIMSFAGSAEVEVQVHPYVLDSVSAHVCKSSGSAECLMTVNKAETRL